MSRLVPRQPTPELDVDTLQQGRWSLSTRQPGQFTLIVFYRGVHCPVCKPYLRSLDRQIDDLAEKGVETIAVSCDTQSRARQAVEDWSLDKVTIGYGMEIAQAREWGLYVSTSRGKTSIGIEEPAQFSEPGLFLVRPDRTLYAASVQTMPFARPAIAELVSALDMIISKDYPARGHA